MRIYCSYNQKMHEFLNEVVELVLHKYGMLLDLDTLEEIELVNKRDLPYETDGKVLSPSKIIVTSRLYELLPILDVNKLKDNEDYGMLRKTLYHEMGHINDMKLMPKLYNYIFEDFQNGRFSAESISSLFWVEYVAEKRTAIFENVYNMGICDKFIKKKWRCSMSDPFAHCGENNFFYLTKVLPYFIARTRDENVREKYISQIENKLLIAYINEIDREIKLLETKDSFDEPIVLRGIYGIIDSYYKKFMCKFN